MQSTIQGNSVRQHLKNLGASSTRCHPLVDGKHSVGKHADMRLDVPPARTHMCRQTKGQCRQEAPQMLDQCKGTCLRGLRNPRQNIQKGLLPGGSGAQLRWSNELTRAWRAKGCNCVLPLSPFGRCEISLFPHDYPHIRALTSDARTWV